jgi:NTE family protein
VKIGLALGSGAARGWSHVGVIKALVRQGIAPDVVCGSSIGALVGAAYCANHLDKLERWVCSLSRLETAKFLEFNTQLNGFVNKQRLETFLQKYVAAKSKKIEALDKTFAAVATELETGREVWITKGPVLDGVWASMSLPGLFPAIRYRDKWLVDGGLVNPVPVSVCRALGADLVIAVNLNGDLVGKHFRTNNEADGEDEPEIREENSAMERIADRVMDYTTSVFNHNRSAEDSPGLLDAIAGSINIVQDRITKSRMAGDPPDLVLTPMLSDISLLEFYRAAEAIEEGEACVERMMPEISRVLNLD